MRLSSSRLAFYKTDPDEIEDEEEADFEYHKAIVIVVSNGHATKLPKIKETYIETMEAKAADEPKKHSTRQAPKSFAALDLSKHEMERIVDAYYGKIEFPTGEQNAMLLVLPRTVSEIHEKVIEKLPIDLLIQEQKGLQKKK